MAGFKLKKAVQVLNFFARKEGGRINKMKALKLIWLADRFHLRRFARTIVGDTYYAMKLGPVASGSKDLAEGKNSSFDSYRNQYLETIDNQNYRSILDVDNSLLSETDEQALQIVYENFGKFDQFELSDISHSFPEWIKFEKDLNAGTPRVKIQESDFFEKTLKPFPIFSDSEAEIALIRDIFNENRSIAN